METNRTNAEGSDQSAETSVAKGPADEQVLQVLWEQELSKDLQDLSMASDSNLIELLQEVQDRLGYLPASALREISRRTRIRLSRIYGVVSFYAQFYTEPRGRHTIRCCRGTACHVKGAARIIDTIRQTLQIEDGQTTSDMQFCLESVACLGTCFLAPVMMIDNQYFGELTPQRAESILKNYRANE